MDAEDGRDVATGDIGAGDVVTGHFEDDGGTGADESRAPEPPASFDAFGRSGPQRTPGAGAETVDQPAAGETAAETTAETATETAAETAADEQAEPGDRSAASPEPRPNERAGRPVSRGIGCAALVLPLIAVAGAILCFAAGILSTVTGCTPNGSALCSSNGPWFEFVLPLFVSPIIAAAAAIAAVTVHRHRSSWLAVGYGVVFISIIVGLASASTGSG